MLINLEIINTSIYMLKNVKYANICKISLQMTSQIKFISYSGIILIALKKK